MPQLDSRRLAIQFGLMAWALSYHCIATDRALAQEELPTDRLLRTLKPSADANDFAAVLTPAQRQSLEDRCRQLREKTGAQLAVVILQSLEGGQIDDFAEKLFLRWGIGQKDRRNGVLLLVAIGDRKARIEVGYGLEPILPDALAGRVLTEQLFPAFRQQRYYDGLAAAVERIAAIIEKNEPPPANLDQQGKPGGLFTIVAILSLFVAVGSFMFGAGLAQRVVALLPFSGFFIAVPFLIGLGIASPWAPLVHIPVGLLAGWFGWRTGQDNLRGPRQRSAGREWIWPAPGPGSWEWGSASGSSGWTGGGFSGGGSDWGGFGGGSSGGGGASGGW